ncbi:MAG TPA: HEPN domain-containing protein [Flavobacteriales bacterium]
MRRKKETRSLKPTEGFFSIKGTDLPVRHGTLTYTPTRGIRLRTYDRFKPDADRYSQGDAKYDTIHGEVEDASHVLLYNCYGHELIRLPGTAHTTYHAEYVVYGYCRLGLHDKRINTMVGRLRHLRKWLDLPGYQSKFGPIEGDPDNKYKHSFISEPSRRTQLYQDQTVAISFGIQRFVPWGKVKNPKRAISETAQVTFRFSADVDLPTAAKSMKELERFLSFVTQIDMPITGVGLKVTKPELDNVTDKRILHQRDQVHPMYHFLYPKMKKRRIVGADPYLYSLALIKDEFQKAYSNWLTIYDRIRPALDQFFEHRYNHEGYEATKHAYYSFIFEALHKKLYPEVGAIRLEKRYAAVLNEFLGTGPYFTQERIDLYNQKLVDARNLVAHEGMLDESGPINFNNLIQYNELNQMLITYMVLAACGLEKSNLLKRLTSREQFTYFQWANAEM